PAFLSRAESRARVEAAEAAGTPWPRDPDGAPHYPGDERSWSQQQRQERQRAQPRHAWRLDMSAALAHVAGRAAGGGVGHAASVQDQTWFEWSGDIDPNNGPLGAWTSGSAAAWGDVVLARSDTPTSYHLSVVLDDAIQGISHVVRGRDLEPATAVHRLLQTLLGLPEPIYHHHDLIVDDDGRKLSKSAKDTALSELRAAGLQPSDIRRMVGLG
ncbi:MAG: glutamate--tRNA ligase family protein, partial [Pseudomonadota bacterium]